MPTVALNGLEMSFEDRGTGDPLVLRFTRAAFESLSAADRDALHARHVHGDEQVGRLYDMMRSFATSDDDMAFTAATLGAITARTVIVHGEHDPYYPTEMALELGPVFGTMAEPFASRALAHLASTTSA